MRRVRILQEAAIEAIEAAAWYEQERLGLGWEFSEAIDAAFDLLEEEIIPLTNMPGNAGKRGIKRIILKRFPYDIVVHPLTDEIVVIAVAHHSRRPHYRKSRLHP